MSIPAFLLKKLYVKGSLKNTDKGFELKLRNTLAPGTLIGLGALTIDDASYPPSAMTITTPAGTVKGDQITSQAPLTFAVNVDIQVAVEGKPLQPGTHHLVFSVLTREIGRLEIDLTDTI